MPPLSAIDSMSNKKLKDIIHRAGLSSADCIEKSQLRARARTAHKFLVEEENYTVEEKVPAEAQGGEQKRGGKDVGPTRGEGTLPDFCTASDEEEESDEAAAEAAALFAATAPWERGSSMGGGLAKLLPVIGLMITKDDQTVMQEWLEANAQSIEAWLISAHRSPEPPSATTVSVSSNETFWTPAAW